ncbi:sensor histidine kinase [Rhodopirellula sp. MGV]|uniref:sensor histidine kinase n=1 Tax=Rhodopirellula sp. MGV TaxID=2023130 RepID=UPI000B96348D|nr:HAMP domain-containing sensor histidine kinase [Rhodopirellula sp. MGV]OYP32992.1 hypothetical protein CGZ80_19055 [Rhodopirellula sp. MGV]PNY35351.1 sensor histidine kinase [Rhodopirellula baltica]
MGPSHLATATPTAHRSTKRMGDATVRSDLSKADIDASFEMVTRLISETAHDLRSPLTTIREAVRLVRDGDLGRVSRQQHECLSAAIEQCNCAGQMVDEMVQSRRFETGFGNIRRSWVSIDEIRHQVESTLQPWALPREISLLWDGPFGQDLMIYADPGLLRRLLVNLANNAVRVTAPKHAVLIRAHRYSNSQILNWSVVDQGCGISPNDLELIASGKAPTQSVGGLGLLICRQLAAAHFSKLRIESRVGTGTAVSFQTPMGGPSAVAVNFAAWRTQLTMPVQTPKTEPDEMVYEVTPLTSRSVHRSARPESIAAPRRVRIDVPSQAVDLGVGNVTPVHPHHMCLTTVALGAAVPNAAVDQFETLLHQSMRITEMAYRTGDRTWVIVFDADAQSALARRQSVERMVENEMQPVRTRWGKGIVISSAIRDELAIKLSSMLADMIVRQTLLDDQQSPSDPNTDFDGKAVTAESIIPSSRLQREVAYLRGY